MNKSHFERYRSSFLKKLDSAEQKALKKIFWGKTECGYNKTKTCAVIFSDAQRKGKSIVNQRNRLSKRETKKDSIVKATLRKYSHLWKFKDEIDDNELSVHARDLANTIHDYPARWTGYRTEAAIRNGEKVKEHFVPRKWAGYQIMKFIFDNNGITYDELKMLYEVFCQVHYSTSVENNRLRALQDSKDPVDWREAYKQKCSPLIHEEERGPILTLDEILRNRIKKVA